MGCKAGVGSNPLPSLPYCLNSHWNNQLTIKFQKCKLCTFAPVVYGVKDRRLVTAACSSRIQLCSLQRQRLLYTIYRAAAEGQGAARATGWQHKRWPIGAQCSPLFVKDCGLIGSHRFFAVVSSLNSTQSLCEGCGANTFLKTTTEWPNML